MEIRYLENNEKNRIRAWYESVFEDKKEYVDFLFSTQINKHKVLVMLEGDKIVSMLQLVPKKVCYRRELLNVHYIFAVATAREYRKKGYMNELLQKALRDLKAGGERFTYLIPTNPAFYEGLGFVYKYKRTIYDLEPVEEKNIVYSPGEMDIKVMMALCDKYLANKYNTFLVHDEEYFDRILKELSIENGYLVYHRDGEEIVAYSLVDSSHNVIESVFKNIPSGLKIKDKKPYVMVKVLDDKTDVGKFFVNDET